MSHVNDSTIMKLKEICKKEKKINKYIYIKYHKCFFTVLDDQSIGLIIYSISILTERSRNMCGKKKSERDHQNKKQEISFSILLRNNSKTKVL